MGICVRLDPGRARRAGVAAGPAAFCVCRSSTTTFARCPSESMLASSENNASIDGMRSLGSLRRQRRIADSTATGIDGSIERGSGGSSVTCLRNTSREV
jgi:hypothetical protein